ncbi:MAG: guanylate kinase [Fimbriimonadaceae bacterium]
MSQTGCLVIFSGPSGVGKDTVLQQWMKSDPNVRKVVSWTTRAPRPGEVNGEDYWFKSQEEFERAIESNHFLEYKNVYGNWYGTPLDQVESLQGAGYITVLKIDVQGAMAAMTFRPDACSIFLHLPSREELVRRLTARQTESPEALAKRIKTAESELDESFHYRYHVTNDEVANAVSELKKVVSSCCSNPV